MALGVTFILVAIAVVAIWIVIEEKRMKHKIFAVFIIALIIFTYFSFSVVLKNNQVDLKSPQGIATGGKLYFSWLGSMFSNVKSITAFAFKQDWKQENITIENSTKNENTPEKIEQTVKKTVNEINSIWDKL